MLRIIVLLLLLTEFGYSQNTVIKLVYNQSVINNSTGEKLERSKDLGLLNSFQPVLMSYVESVSNLRKEIFVGKNNIHVDTYLSGLEEIYSSKIEQKGKLYYLNNLTGEERLFEEQNVAFKNHVIPTKFKLKNKRSNASKAIEIYKAESVDMVIEYHVDPKIAMKKNTDLSKVFLYDKKLILKKIQLIKKENKKIIHELVLIDTLKNQVQTANGKKDPSKQLLSANKKITLDSINFNEEVPDIYLKKIGTNRIFSLNEYKGNGKYLMVDFWGTWCKPCLASIPELRSFYQEFSDQLDLLSLNYKDSNETRVNSKIQEFEMDWEQGIVTEAMKDLLNPKSYFPGILLFDDKMRLIVRDKSKPALIKARDILEN